jgi:hypothetical protein
MVRIDDGRLPRRFVACRHEQQAGSFSPMFNVNVARTCATSLAACLALTIATPVKADDLAKRITVNVAPVFLFSSNGDANGPFPAGYTILGKTNDNPTANTARVNFGADLRLDNGPTHLSYSHTNVAYQLGQITTLGPKTALVTGAIYDYTDTIALSHAFGNGFSGHISYNSHQRQDVTGLCLNQKFCPNAAGVQQPDPASIDEIYYQLGGTYNFGPKSIVGKIFTVGADAKYEVRSGTPSDPAYATGGLGHYVGSTVLFPYSATAYVPIIHDPTVIPFINYTSLPVLYHDSAVPEEYRGIVFGLVKVINKNVTFSYTNLNLQSCRCISRVPPPDNLRLAFGIVSLDFHTGL